MTTKYNEYIKTTYSTKYLPFGKEIITQEIELMPDDADEFNKKMDCWKTHLQPDIMITLYKKGNAYSHTISHRMVTVEKLPRNGIFPQ